MSSEELEDDYGTGGGRKPTFAKQGRGYQEKCVQALLQDHTFAEQMQDVLDPSYFSLVHLKSIVERLFRHRKDYKTYPTPELIGMMLEQDEQDGDVALLGQAKEFLKASSAHPLNGDMRWVQDNVLEFCRRQALIDATAKILDKVEEKDYGSITKILREALEKGAPRDAGHEYSAGLSGRVKKSVRAPISTGWPVLDRELHGGWERKTLTTFIAPTGAGKSMFLANIAAAGIEQGLNVLYCTLEMADYKIGLRIDSYFSGIAINDINLANEQKVADVLAAKVKGRLIIKEWPTKRASVQTIRTHLQKLETSDGFKPDILLLDYADLLKGNGAYGEKRHELEGVYEELRGIAQEFNIVLITADQTNRSGLNEEVVTLSSIAEAYAKATVCDLIVTISRRADDKVANAGRIFIAKSRLGRDGVVFPFVLNPATVKVLILDQNDEIMAKMLGDPTAVKKDIAERYSGTVNGKNLI